MDYETVPARDLGHSLKAITVNLLCRDLAAEVRFLTKVFGMEVYRQSKDFAIVVHAGQPMQLHSDGAFSSNPLSGLLPEAGLRGTGIEIRLHEANPDEAASRAEAEGGMVLQAPTDKKGHGLREAILLSPAGYAFVPSCRI